LCTARLPRCQHRRGCQPPGVPSSIDAPSDRCPYRWPCGRMWSRSSGVLPSDVSTEMATDGPGRGPEPSVRKEVRPVTSARLVVFCCCRTVGQSMWRDRHPSPTRHYKRITSRSCRRRPVGPGAGGIGIPDDGHPEAAELTGDHGRPQPRDLCGQRYHRTFRAVVLCAADRAPGAGDGLQQPEGSANGYARAREPCEQRSMRPPTLTDGGEIHSITLSWRLLPLRTEPCAAVAIRRPDARGLS